MESSSTTSTSWTCLHNIKRSRARSQIRKETSRISWTTSRITTSSLRCRTPMPLSTKRYTLSKLSCFIEQLKKKSIYLLPQKMVQLSSHIKSQNWLKIQAVQCFWGRSTLLRVVAPLNSILHLMIILEETSPPYCGCSNCCTVTNSSSCWLFSSLRTSGG